MANLTMENLVMVMRQIIKEISMVVDVLVRIGVSIGFTPSETRMFLVIVFGVSAGIRIAHNNAVFARRLRTKQREINKKIYGLRDAVNDMYEPKSKEREKAM